MNVNEFIAKWRRVELTERSASQQHFLDLCEVFEHPKPAAVDARGEWFTFERGADKQGGGRGWADVWKRGHFGWEYKGKHKDLKAAYKQLLDYREALENPPLLVVCDMDLIVVHTNFTATSKATFEISLAELGEPHNLEIMRAVFHEPEKLHPRAVSAAITKEAAKKLAGVANTLRARGLEPTAVARFLDRVVFCLFAEDVGLLPRGLFTEIADGAKTPEQFAKYLGLLFEEMRKGGDFYMKPIRHFNGSLFAEGQVLSLTGEEIRHIREAAHLDWGAVDPSIFGTLFERGLDPDTRAQLGAQYTSREDIETLIEPVVMAPLRREWDEVRREVEELLAQEQERMSARGPVLTRRGRQARQRALKRAAGEPRALLRGFHDRLQEVKVLDPACGSGNFLYVTLQKLKDLEKEVLDFASATGLGAFLPGVGPQQFYGIEINPYAFDLAQTTLWIGYLQWIQSHGYGWPPDPLLSHMDNNFFNIDAILDLADPDNPREPDWPEVDFIVGNPPFLGDKLMRRELGDDYVDKLRTLYGSRIPGMSDLVCYWFEKARKQIEGGKAKRAGLLATQGIRGGANREVLKRIKETGDIFFAISDRDWILDGANVHVSIVGLDDGSEQVKTLDGQRASSINANLSATADITSAQKLSINKGISFIGAAVHGPFDIDETKALSFLREPTVSGKPNSDAVRLWANSLTITKRETHLWIVDYPPDTEMNGAVLYESPFEYVRNAVYPVRSKNRRASRARLWWILGDPQKAMRQAIGSDVNCVAELRE